MRAVAGNALRVLLGLVLGLALAELAARAWLEWLPQPKNGTYLRDEAIGYRLRPEPARGDTAGNPYHVNALGFRDHEHPPVKPPGVRRVLGIGDSFVAGEVALEDNFLRVAGRRWNQEARSLPTAGAADPGVSAVSTPAGPVAIADSVEVVLMGLGGYGPEQYVAALRTVGLATGPDLVLLCFYVGNDVTGVATRHEIRRGELYSTGSSNPRLDLCRRSDLFAWLEKRLFFRQRREQARVRQRELDAGPPDDSVGSPEPAMPPTRLYLEVIANRRPLYAAVSSARIAHLWATAERSLDDFDRTCRKAGVPWALVLIPDEFQVDPSVRESTLRRLGARDDALDLDGPQRRLGLWASGRRVAVLDLLPLFRAAQVRSGPLYISNDTHWNEKGNRLAGEAVASFTDSLTGWRPRRAGVPAAPAAVRAGGISP